MSLWGSNLNFFIIPAHHFLIALNKMHTYGNYMTSSYKWHLSEGGNYNEVVLTNTFLKFKPSLHDSHFKELNVGVMAFRNWHHDGTDTIVYVLYIGHFFTEALFVKGEQGRRMALHFGAIVENSFPHWNAVSSNL